MATLADALLGQRTQPEGPIPLASLNPMLGGSPTWADAAGAAGDWLAQQRAISAQRGLWGDQGPTQSGAQDAAKQLAMGLVFGSTAPSFRAFHGSPYDFNAFDASKIGTGEGAQAYGHGLYFAQAEPVAQGYRRGLSGSGVDIVRGDESLGKVPSTNILNDPQFVQAYNQLMPADGVPGWIKAGILRDIRAAGETGKNVDLAATRQASVERMTKEMARFSPEVQQRAIGDINKAYDSIGGDVQFRAPGRMYEVQINADPQHFLDWDKPLHQQTPEVQERISKILGEDVSQTPTSPFNGRPLTGPWNPGGAYERVVAKFGLRREGADIAATQAMRDAGIPGIRYLDAGSRGAKDPINLVGGKPYDPSDPIHGASMALTWTNGDRVAAADTLERLAAKPDAESPAQMRAAAAVLRGKDAVPPLTQGQPPGTSNFVVFDPASIEIIRKYGIAGLLAGGGAAATQGGQQ